MISLCAALAAGSISTVQDVPSCYTTDTELLLTRFNNSICMKLASEKNSDCQVLQRGINVTVQMIVPIIPSSSGSSGPSGSSGANTPTTEKIAVSGFYQQFSYNTTTFMCILVEAPNQDKFHTATSAQVTMNSISHSTTFTPGILTRIASDNSRFINTTESFFYMKADKLCLNLSLNSNLAGSFQNTNIENATVLIGLYYVNNVNTNWSMIYKKNRGTNQIIEYDGTKNQLNICFNDKGLEVYTKLDITATYGIVNMYYQSGSIMQYYEATVLNFNYDSAKIVYSELRAIIMSNRVSMQTILDPDKQTEADELNAQQKSFANVKRVEWVFLYCIGNKENAATAYSRRVVFFDNATKYYTQNFYAENESLQSNIDLLFEFKVSLGCSIGGFYESFVYNGDQIAIQYQQEVLVVLYTCFKSVKYYDDGRMVFERNRLACEQFEHEAGVFFIIYDHVEDNEVAKIFVNDFSAGTLTYGTGLTDKVDGSRMTLQITDADGRLLDEILFTSAADSDVDALGRYGIVIIASTGAQIVACIIYIALRKRVAQYHQSRHERALAARRARQDTLDL